MPTCRPSISRRNTPPAIPATVGVTWITSVPTIIPSRPLPWTPLALFRLLGAFYSIVLVAVLTMVGLSIRSSTCPIITSPPLPIIPAAETSSTVLVASIIFLDYSSVVIHYKTEVSRSREGDESLVNRQLELVVTTSRFVAAAINIPSSGVFSQGILICLVQ